VLIEVMQERGEELIAEALERLSHKAEAARRQLAQEFGAGEERTSPQRRGNGKSPQPQGNSASVT
jgi:hypothetical protein